MKRNSVDMEYEKSSLFKPTQPCIANKPIMLCICGVRNRTTGYRFIMHQSSNGLGKVY